jgi:hypothetical protein
MFHFWRSWPGCRGLLGWCQGKIAVLASNTALSAAHGAKTVIFAAPARAKDTTRRLTGPEAQQPDRSGPLTVIRSSLRPRPRSTWALTGTAIDIPHTDNDLATAEPEINTVHHQSGEPSWSTH